MTVPIAMKGLAQITRRDFLSTGAAFLAASHLRSGLPRTTDGFITFINLVGGNDALNTLVPTRLQAYALQRPGIAITPTAGLPLDTGPFANSDYVLHPAMPALASLYRAGSVAFVRMVGYPGANIGRSSLARLIGRGGQWKTTPVIAVDPGASHYLSTASEGAMELHLLKPQDDVDRQEGEDL